MNTKNKKYYFLKKYDFYIVLIVSLIIGSIIAIITSLFWSFLIKSMHYIWSHIPLPNWYILLICAVGGLIVGILRKYLGAYPKGIHEDLNEFKKTKRFDSKHIFHSAANSFTSLSFGGNIGPEAALMNLSGGLSTLNGDYLRYISKKLSLRSKINVYKEKYAKKTIIILTLIVGLLVFISASNYLGVTEEFFDITNYEFYWSHVFWIVPASLIGMILGYIFLYTDRKIGPYMDKKFKDNYILKSFVGGLVLGIFAIFVPLVLFSGESYIHLLQANGTKIAWYVLLFSGIFKLLLNPFLVASEWRGGKFFPIMSSAAMVSLLLCIVFPQIPTIIVMMAAMASIVTITLKKPLIAFALMFILVPFKFSLSLLLLESILVTVLIGNIFEKKSK